MYGLQLLLMRCCKCTDHTLFMLQGSLEIAPTVTCSMSAAAAFWGSRLSARAGRRNGCFLATPGALSGDPREIPGDPTRDGVRLMAGVKASASCAAAAQSASTRTRIAIKFLYVEFTEEALRLIPSNAQLKVVSVLPNGNRRPHTQYPTEDPREEKPRRVSEEGFPFSIVERRGWFLRAVTAVLNLAP